MFSTKVYHEKDCFCGELHDLSIFLRNPKMVLFIINKKPPEKTALCQIPGDSADLGWVLCRKSGTAQAAGRGMSTASSNQPSWAWTVAEPLYLRAVAKMLFRP